MGFLSPLALLTGLLAIPILALYMLRLRRRPVQVSSTLLWQRLMRDREANAPWQRLRRNLLLVLQLLILLALCLALARPFLAVPSLASERVAVLLDASASMRASDESPSRFDAARATARRLVDELPQGGRMTLIRVGTAPEVLASEESARDVLRRAIDAARPDDGPADWQAAFALAAGALGGAAADRSAVIVISDGGLPDDLPPLPAQVRYVPIGNRADNLALAALALRPATDGLELFARVTNHGDQAQQAVLSFTRDGLLFHAEEISVPAGDSRAVLLSGLPDQPAVYRASLSAPAESSWQDWLAVDDVAHAVYQPAVGGRVLVISPGNVFLEQVLAAMPGIEPFRAPADASLPSEPFDLYVFDGILPASIPEQDLLLIDPPANALFDVTGDFEVTGEVRVADDPLTQHVDWSGVHIRRAKRVVPPAWAKVLVEAPDGPLVFVGEHGGRRVAVLTFDLHESDLPLQVAFPILMSSLIGYLSPAQPFQAPDGVQPGASLAIRPGLNVQAVVVTDPLGVAHRLDLTESGATFSQTQGTGLYTVDYLAGETPVGRDTFAVNLFSAGESDIRPRDSIRVGQSAVAAAPRRAVGQRELWPWLAVVAVLVLNVEWWVYHRGRTWPTLPRRWITANSSKRA